MYIIYPFCPGVREEDQEKSRAAVRALEAAGWEVDYIELPPGAPLAYWQALRDHWDNPHDWLVVEHDVAPSVDLVTEMAACPRLLCTRGYGLPVPGDPWAVMLGCTKFSARARQRTGWPLPEPVAWHLLDSYLTGAVVARLGLAEGWHQHTAPLVHYHGRKEAT